MKNLSRNILFFLATVLFISMFSSCKKDGPLTGSNPSTQTPQTNTTANSPTNTLLALTQGGGGIESDSMNLCDCFALFDNVDWTASEAEIQAEIEAILAGLSPNEIEALFTPVCTPNGEAFINACVAECNGVFDYEVCEIDDLCNNIDDYCDVDFDDCFTINYPISILLPDGTTTTANSDDELETIFEDWYTANPNSNEEPQIVYPFKVTVDSTVVTINNDDEIEALLEDCFDDEYEIEDCFEFVYPITVVFPDGSSSAVNSDDELWTAVENWYDANPNSNEDPTLEYPVNVLLDSMTVTINNDDELDDLFEDCFDHEYDECFTFVFPLEILLPDGTTVATNDEDELFTAIEDWYTANPNSNEEPEFVFPLQVELDDGTVVTINDENELDDLFDDCYGGFGGCFVTSDSNKALTKGTAKMAKSN